jgi:hypothetical protein
MTGREIVTKWNHDVGPLDLLDGERDCLERLISAALREARAEALEEAARVIEVDFVQGIQAVVAATPAGDLPMVYERYLSRLMGAVQRAGATMAYALRARAKEARHG